jgi:hypothetical protein
MLRDAIGSIGQGTARVNPRVRVALVLCTLPVAAGLILAGLTLAIGAIGGIGNL